MSIIDDFDKLAKKQPGKRYRFIRQDPDNYAKRTYQGFEVVSASDPEIKGTPLERAKNSEGHVRAGGSLVLARISETRARELDKQSHDKQERRLTAIREGFRKQGEDIKRKLGSAHGSFKTIIEEEDK